MQWLDSVAGPGYAAALLWTFAALVLLVIVLVIIRLVRSLTFGTFVAGGRNRKTRLAVMDATAVDSHRRLVLVRRDDIEHLLLIGGPTDVVVERDIEMSECPTGELRANRRREAEIRIGFAAFDGCERGQRIGVDENACAWIALAEQALKRETLFGRETGAPQLAARERRAAFLARHHG